MSYEPTYSRSFVEIIKKTCADLYNHMSYTALISLIWFFSAAPLAVFCWTLFQYQLQINQGQLGLWVVMFLLSAMILTVPYGAFILGPIQCALYYLGGEILEDRARLRSFLDGLRLNYFLAVKVYAIYLVVAFATITDFYISFFLFQSIFLKIVGVVFLYIFTFLFMLGTYIPGFIVLQENTALKVLKKAFLLTLDNLPLSLLMSATYLFLCVLGIFFPVLIPLLMLAYGAFLQFTGVRTFLGLMSKYPDPAPVEEQSGVSGQE